MKAVLSGAILLLLVLVGGSPVAAQSNSPTVGWDRFDVDITAQTDGSLAIREVQTITFRGQLREGFRVIPTERTTGISDVAVSEVTSSGEQPYVRGAGQPGTFSVGQQSDGLGVTWWFVPATDTSRTFVLTYVAHGAIRQYPDGDQVFWQAAYADRPGPVASGTIAVHLPVDTPSSMPSALYLIDARGNPTREVGPGRHVDARTVQFALPQLPESTGAEVRVGFPHGAITAPPPPWQAEADRADQIRQTVAPIGTFLALLLTLAIVVGGGIGLFMLWYTRGREPAIGATPGELDQPPSDLPAPLAGTLVDGRADLQDAVAALVDLGDQGVLSMTEEPERSDVLVTLRRPIDDPALRPYERVLLTALFDSGASSGQIRLSEARTRFAAAVPVLEDRLHTAVAAEGLFTENPQQVRTRYLALGVVLVIAGLGLAFLTGMLLGWAVPIIWLPGVALAVIGGATAALAQAMTRRTPRGALEAARWRAFRAHLADEQNEGAIDPHHLAYAVAFGMDKRFLRRLEQVGSSAPGWYGPGPVVVVPGGWYGGPRHGGSDGSGGGIGPMGGPAGGPSSVSPQGWSDALAGLLTAASDALSHGGGSGGWSGGSFGGGGGGGGGSGGFR